MANNVRTDRFGQPYTVVGCKDKKGSGFCSGIVTLGGKTYKIEPSQSQKEGVEMWVRITQLKKQQKQSM